MTTLFRLAALAALFLIPASPSALAQASAAQAAGRAAPSPLAPSEIADAAPKADWTPIARSDLLVMDLAPDANGRPRRVVIQLMPPPFSQGWIGNIRKLAAAHWWDGMAINRVQDNYVVQWGDPDADDKAKAKALPAGLKQTFSRDYQVRTPAPSYGDPGGMALTNGVRGSAIGPASDLPYAPDFTSRDLRDIYAGAGFTKGWPVGFDNEWIWPVHCYGMVGVGRDMPPSAGTGAELYVVIGQAPRHLDRNIALVGRVIEGIENLSSLPRGHGALGFYDLAQGDERVPILSLRLGSEVQGLPAYEYLSTASRSFARYADARANRRDPFFIRPAGGADICNVPVPVRRAR